MMSTRYCQPLLTLTLAFILCLFLTLCSLFNLYYSFLCIAIGQSHVLGYPAYRVIGKSSGNVTYYKVRIGSFKDMAEAESALKKMKKEKIEGIIVVNTQDDD